MTYSSFLPSPLLLGLLAICTVPTPALAETWVQYYRTGSVLANGTVWTLYEVDTDSIKREGKYLAYRTRLNHPEEGLVGVTDMRVECESQTRGQLPDTAMYSVYKGTIGGEELRAVCEAAQAKGK